jgi:peptidylprolyl isomerase
VVIKGEGIMKKILARFKLSLAVLLLSALPVFAAEPTTKGDTDLENTLYLELKDGRVVIQLRPDLAPKHVARIKELAREGFYDGVVFHRVIEGFMAQTGDPTGTGMGGSGKKLQAEFSAEPHVRGVVSMARAQDPNSADSQFFIVLEDANYLDRNYTVWGKVTEGMDHVDAIKKGDPAANGKVEDPDKIISLRVAADVAKDAAAAPAAAEGATPPAAAAQ